MAQPTPAQLELTNAVVQRVNTVDWNGNIDPYVDEIVDTIERLLAMDAARVDFVEAIKNQAVQWSLAAWGDGVALTVADSGWSRLADRLAPYLPSDG